MRSKLLHVTVEKSQRETEEKEQEVEMILFADNGFKFIPLVPASHWRAAFLCLAFGQLAFCQVNNLHQELSDADAEHASQKDK